MLSFHDARAKAGGYTQPRGYADDTHYSVLPLEPRDDDEVVLVDRKTGKVTRPPYFEVREKLQAMEPCYDLEG